MEPMNEKKICFIMCVNNDAYEQEQMRYLNRLVVPEGYEMDILSVRDALSMTSGYNEGMRVSDAKYICIRMCLLSMKILFLICWKFLRMNKLEWLEW